MTTGVACPVPILQFFNNAGQPNSGGSILTQVGGVNQATFQDAALATPLPNPIPLNSRGEISNVSGTSCQLWLTPNIVYTFTLFDANGNQLNQASTVEGLQLNQASIGQLLYPQTAEEQSAGVTPTNYWYPPLQPERYGAVGNGTTDDSAALNSLIAVLNASPGATSTWLNGKTYYASTLAPITAAGVTLVAYATILAKPVTTSSSLLTVSGNSVTLRGPTVNGNQANFASTYQNGLLVTANNVTLEDMVITQCSASGLIVDSISTTNTTITGLTINNVTLNQNSNFGYFFNDIAYSEITGLTTENNGWGFQGTYNINSPGSGGMGGTIRFRSHHVTFTNAVATKNGIDGLNTNQGSYAIKYINPFAWQNGDGGMTIAGDNTGTGRPGEGEVCRDIEIVNPETYNNWGSGIIAETTVYNLTVSGGRNYNNGRGMGLIPFAVTACAGVALAPLGSLGAVIKTKCYDDRQVCPVTANAGGVLTATNWGYGFTSPGVPGTTFVATAQNYPRVALYNAAFAFQGYGTITAEGANSVTIQTTADNGVSIGAIAAGWWVSQRVQHNGCHMTSGNSGTVDIDGFGHLPAVTIDTGLKVLSSSSAAGQNVRNVNPQIVTSPELLQNPSFDSGIGSGTTWNYVETGGGTATAYTTAGEKLYSPGGLAMTGGTSNCLANSVSIPGGYSTDCWFEVSVIAWAQTAGAGGIVAYYNANVYTTTVYHPGGGTKRLTIGGYLLGVNSINLQLFAAAGESIWFDEASIKVKFEPIDDRDFFYPSRNLPY